MPSKETKKEKKTRRWNDLQDASCKYNKVLFVEVDNVTSKQISSMRRQLRAINAKMIMGKNVRKHSILTIFDNILLLDSHESILSTSYDKARGR